MTVVIAPSVSVPIMAPVPIPPVSIPVVPTVPTPVLVVPVSVLATAVLVVSIIRAFGRRLLARPMLFQLPLSLSSLCRLLLFALSLDSGRGGGGRRGFTLRRRGSLSQLVFLIFPVQFEK